MHMEFIVLGENPSASYFLPTLLCQWVRGGSAANAADLKPRVSIFAIPSHLPNTNLNSFPSPMDCTRQMPPFNHTPDMSLSSESSRTAHTRSVMLPRTIQAYTATGRDGNNFY
jgi:hypothetical protein